MKQTEKKIEPMSNSIAGVKDKIEEIISVAGDINYYRSMLAENPDSEGFNYDEQAEMQKLKSLLDEQPIPVPDVEDLQEQVRKHISSHDLFDWDEALTGEEMIYLENLLLTFAPIFYPGSIGFEKTVRPYLQQPIPVNQDEKELWENIIVKIENAEFLKHKYVDTINELKSKYTVQLKSSPSPTPQK